MRCCLSSTRHYTALSIGFNLQQCICQSVRVAAQLAAGLVSHILAGAGYSHLNQHSCQRCQNHHKNTGNRVAAFAVLVTAASEEHAPLSNRGNRACHRSSNRAYQNIAVLNVAQLMAKHACQLFLRQHICQRRIYSNSSMLRVTACSESVRYRAVDNINLRHRKVGLLRQLLHNAIQLRSRASVYLLSVVMRQHQLITVPIGKNVHRYAYKQHHGHTAQAAEKVTDEYK